MRLLRPAAVEVRGLRARGGVGRSLIHGLDLSVPVGARLLLVSRPESASTLLLRILAGLSRPASGSFLIAGASRPDDSAEGWARRFGYVGPDPAIYPWLTPLEALGIAARLAGLAPGTATRRAAAAVEELRLGPDAERPIRRGGPMVAQKTALAAALVGEPEVLLLDEPLRSVDPAERHRLLRFPDRRLTVVIASRYPASEEGLVNQVALIRDGRLALHARLEELSAAGLPLSLRGVEALADHRGGVAVRLDAPSPPATATG